MSQTSFHTARLTSVGRLALRAGAPFWGLAIRLGLATRRCTAGCNLGH